MNTKVVKTTTGTVIDNPPVARFLFDDTRFAVVWTVVRVLLGISWITSGWGKLNNPAWVQTGEALQKYWANAVVVKDGKGPITFDWYRAFIQGLLDSGSYVWFAKLVALGETLIGVAFIIGAFVGIAAFFAGLMNWNFMMAGSASSNPLFFLVAVLLVLAWKTAGYWGADRFLLPRLGTPWTPRRKVQTEDSTATPQPTAAK